MSTWHALSAMAGGSPRKSCRSATGTRNVDDILQMTVDQALDFFADRRKIVATLAPLNEVGLGYLRLGQPLNTLSGGEAQRLKLSRYLAPGRARDDGLGRLLIFDEPTTGLHFEDIRILLNALQTLVDRGHSVLVIEHHLDVIKAADWIIDLGPEGGDRGGRVYRRRAAGDARPHQGFAHGPLS